MAVVVIGVVIVMMAMPMIGLVGMGVTRRILMAMTVRRTMFVVEPLAGARIVGEHQRLDGHRHGARRQADLAEIDIVEIPQHHAVYHQHADRYFQLVLKDMAKRLRDIAVELRMAVYDAALAQKQKAWAAIAGDVTYARARHMNAMEFDHFIGQHAHGFSRTEFWALVRVMQGDPEREAAFLRKANKCFQEWYDEHSNADFVARSKRGGKR